MEIRRLLRGLYRPQDLHFQASHSLKEFRSPLALKIIDFEPKMISNQLRTGLRLHFRVLRASVGPSFQNVGALGEDFKFETFKFSDDRLKSPEVA